MKKQNENVENVIPIETDHQDINRKSAEESSGNQKVIPEMVRINVQALDTLMSQAGELVLSRNQLVDAISRNDKRAITTSAQRLSFVISELQEAVMYKPGCSLIETSSTSFLQNVRGFIQESEQGAATGNRW